MATQLSVEVVDGNFEPIAGATVGLGGTTFSGTTDASGTITLPLPAQQKLQIAVAHPFYVSESASFEPDVATGTWNNSLFSRKRGGDTTVLRVQLGRCASAPVKYLSDQELGALGKGKTAQDPGAVLLMKWPMSPDQYVYRFQWFSAFAVREASAQLLPDQMPSDDKKGWDRFQAQDSAVLQLADKGRFFWLTYPQQPADNQFVLAIWSPNLPADAPVPSLDMMVFFSPHTASYRGSYPFGVNFMQGQSPDQPYMTLGASYLLNNYCFIEQLGAKINPTVIVMPICRHGDWGPFATSDAILRMLREVAVFLQRECRTSGLGVSKTAYDPAYRLAGASLRAGGDGIRQADFGITPSIGKVAISFFSTGAAAAKQVLGSTPGNMAGGFPGRYWGAGASGNAWTTAFRELWDMDGFHPKTGGWPTYLTLLSRWYTQVPGRVLRLWHSSGRVPPNPRTGPEQIWKDLKATGITVDHTLPPKLPSGYDASEMQGETWSVISFSDSYVANGSDKVHPVLGDGHHATAMVAFSHGATLTTLGVRPMQSFQRGP